MELQHLSRRLNQNSWFVSSADPTPPAPPGLIDLASERVGGVALIANDEFFAEKENLLKPGRGIFIADKFTDRGKWMDGWETRRRRKPGNDWCVIQLGLRGVIKHVDIDTNHFLGNHPPFGSLDAISKAGSFPKASPRSEGSPGNRFSKNLLLTLARKIFLKSRATKPRRTCG